MADTVTSGAISEFRELVNDEVRAAISSAIGDHMEGLFDLIADEGARTRETCKMGYKLYAKALHELVSDRKVADSVRLGVIEEQLRWQGDLLKRILGVINEGRRCQKGYNQSGTAKENPPFNT